jgi:signal transduction histidine kinase
LAYAINKFYRRNYKKKLLELENEHRIQLERERISRDLHDNIGAYANAVLYNTELLEKQEGAKQKEDLMKGLKFASKDIITSLRATIWALKKDNYSAEECLLRIRNFIQPFTNYYPDINFKVQGEASAQKQLHYTKALNVVRIVQEAITNAIKHSAARNIKVESNEKDGNWQLTISDDGTGFNEDAITGTEQGSGLNNMKKRAIDSHLELAFTSQPGKGTKINILIKI